MEQRATIKILIERVNKLSQLTPTLLFNRYIWKVDGTEKRHLNPARNDRYASSMTLPVFFNEYIQKSDGTKKRL